jgi:hypothetical protein
MPVDLPKVVARGVDTLVLNVYYYDGQHKPCKRDLPLALKELLAKNCWIAGNRRRLWPRNLSRSQPRLKV